MLKTWKVMLPVGLEPPVNVVVSVAVPAVVVSVRAEGDTDVLAVGLALLMVYVPELVK